MKPAMTFTMAMLLAAATTSAQPSQSPSSPQSSQSSQSSSSSQPSPRRFRVVANVSYHPTERGFEDTETFIEFLEEGTLRQSYRGGTGVSFEIGGIYSIIPSFGLLGSFARLGAEHDATFDLAVPHPLFFDQNRSVRGELTDLTYTEQAFHLDGVYTVESGPWLIDVFGGATLFSVETELLDETTTSSVYPFDELDLTGTSTVVLEDNPVGFNVGGAVSYWFTSLIGVGFQARYSAATATHERDDGRTLELDAGGFRVGGGVRIGF